MYQACFMDIGNECVHTAEGDTPIEAITKAWRVEMALNTGEDVSSWEPEDLRVTDPADTSLKHSVPIPKALALNELMIVVDMGRMTAPCGFIRRLT